nr:hypothetical protein [Tanacetum cinerariifolium]
MAKTPVLFTHAKHVGFNLEYVILNNNNEVPPFTQNTQTKRVLRVNTFRKAIGTHYLSHSGDYVDPPFIDLVRPWFSTIRYKEEVSAKGTLKKSLLPPSNEETEGGSSKALTGSKTGPSRKRKESSLARDSNLSQPLVFTPVDTGIHKEDQQAAGGPTSLGVNSEEGSHPQLSSGYDASADSIAEADPETSP